MLDSGNSVGLGDDNVRDKGCKYDVNSGCRSSGWAVKVTDSTIDGGEDGLLVDSDGVPDRSKKDGIMDDDDGDNDERRKASWWAVKVSNSTIDGGEEGVLMYSVGVRDRSKNDGMLDDVGLDDDVDDDDDVSDDNDDDGEGVEGILLVD